MNLNKKGKYRKAIFCVIYQKQDNQVLYLLLKRKLHWKGWEFPKGGVENYENLTKALKREIKEETGQNCFNIKKYNFSGKFKYKKIYADRPGLIGQTYKLFSAEIKNKKIKIDKNEHIGYKWFDFEKSIKLLTFNNQKQCLKIVNKEIIK
jgi:8-oxo-dGTP pyrophosphatase MutT (NUDIX family)